MDDPAQTIIVTVDVVMFGVAPGGGLKVLLPPRPREPFAGVQALPGVYIQSNDADAQAAAKRARVVKAGVESPYLEQLATFSGPARDPRGWAVSIAYYALVPWGVLGTAAAQMVDVNKLPRLPFDHDEIIDAALARLRSKSSYSELPLHLMPPLFTLAELQDVYERVMEEEISRTLFRKRMVDGGLIVETGEMSRGGAHRPAAVFRRGQGGVIAPIPALSARMKKQ